MTASTQLITYAEDQILYLYKSSIWREFEFWTRRYRNAAELQFRRFFGQQQAEVIEAIEMGKSVVKGPESWLDLRKWQLLFEEYGQLLLPEVIGDKGALELEKLIIGVGFDVENPRVTAFINRESFKFSFQTNATTREALRQAFVTGIAAGEGVPGLTVRINAIFTGMKRYRAEMIARDQVIRASNFAAEQAYIQSGVVLAKEWVTSLDARVCPYCEPMNGKRQSLGFVYFQLGDTLPNSDFPNQTLNLNYEDIFHPPLHPQCRCTLVPITVA